MRRRTFISTSAVAGFSLQRIRAATVAAGDIPKRVFGKTGEKLTIIGQAGGRFPMCSYEEAKAITLRAYELGINYFDCARIYFGTENPKKSTAMFCRRFASTSFSPPSRRSAAARAPKRTSRSLCAR